jgi:hexosaminidase
MSDTLYRLQAKFAETGSISCVLSTSSDSVSTAPVLCFSLLDEPQVISGGTRLETLGGFCAIRLDGTLTSETPLRFEVAYPARHGVKVVNRAWLPQGVYIRADDGSTTGVKTGPSGVVETGPAPKVHDSGILRLVPPPTSWRPANGICSASAFHLKTGDPFDGAFAAVDALALRNGTGAFLQAAGVPVTLTKASDLPPEGYRLQIGADEISITASDRAGAFHAAITLLTLRTTYGGKLPVGTLQDAPRFSWRGQHLDCARHYFQPETIYRLIDLMALLKLNVFHWHFADDEAFRLQVTSFPELWQKSEFRGEGQTIPGVFGGGAGPTGGSYTLKMARQLVRRAKEIGIDVLPEIEVPAHALVLARIFPNLRDPDDTGTEASVQSYRENTINPALPEMWDFVFKLSTEVASIFPFAHLHLGGDELPDKTWQGSPMVAGMLAQDNQMQTMQDVQGYTMERLAAYLGELNIRPCAWEEGALGSNGGIGNDALLFSWSGQGPGLTAARRGYQVVMCPGQHAYFEMAHSDRPDDWGGSWAAVIGLGDTVDWDPVPADEPELESNIMGVEGAFWGEFTTLDTEMEPMLAPRILGLAAKAWSAQGAIDRRSITELAGHYGPLFETIGWQWHKGALTGG